MIQKITSFTHHVTGEGSRISATYSTIDESGNLVDTNKRFNVIVVDDAVAEAVEMINNFLKDRIPGGSANE